MTFINICPLSFETWQTEIGRNTIYEQGIAIADVAPPGPYTIGTW